MGQDVNVSQDRFRTGANFCNKLWNTSRFILMMAPDAPSMKLEELDRDKMEVQDRWILTGASRLIKDVARLIENYDLNEAAQSIYRFMWHDFCDWYLEICKVNKSDMNTAVYVISRFIRMLNPIMPYITEEINSIIGGTGLIQASYGKTNEYTFNEDSNNVNVLRSLITAMRNLIAETGTARIEIMPEQSHRKLTEDNAGVIKELAKAEQVEITDSEPEKSVPGIFDGGMVFVRAENIADIEDRIRRYNKDKEQLEKEIEKIARNLSNEAFTGKAPEDVVNKMREKEIEFQKKLERVKLILGRLG